MSGKNLDTLCYAKMGCDTLLKKFNVSELPPINRFYYHQGVFLSGMERTYLLSGDEKYYDYIKSWVDIYIDADGELHHPKLWQFDDMQPAILLFNLYEKTGDERYKKVLDRLASSVDMWPKNAHGGFWHNFNSNNQMWLDTLYMIGPYMTMYASKFEKPYFYEIIFQNMNLMRRNMTDPKTGLLYHAWDDSKTTDWADKKTGLSPIFWGRAIGWYAVSILDILDYIPKEHPRRQEFIDAEISIINALIKYQDENTGLWYQVVNRGDDPQNWHETSCSSLYTYSLSKAIRTGIIDKSYEKYMHKGYEGIINSLRIEGDDLIVGNVCVGTWVGDYEFYLKRQTVENDLHGMGAFLLMCTEYYSATRG